MIHSFNRLPLYKGERELAGLQALKLICALMVVQIHTYSIVLGIALPLCRIAVPVFFMISGYFLISKDGCVSSKKISSVFVKIFKIALYATLAYLAFEIALTLLAHGSLDKYFTPMYWLRQLVFGDAVRVHIWYLVAYLQTLALIYVLLKTKMLKALFFLIPIGLAANLMIGCYGFLLFDAGNGTPLSRNALTIAIPCVAMGMLIRLFEDRLPSQKVVVACLIVSVMMLYAEQIAISHSPGDIIAMTIPVSALTFVFFLRLDCANRYMAFAVRIGKKHSLDIYLWHPMVAVVYSYFVNCLGLYNGMSTFVVALITLGLSMLINPATLPVRCWRFFRGVKPWRT